jgi:hypothetical protein
MEKFSSISKQDLKKQPELVTNKQKIKLEALKAGINSLIDNFLTIRYNGSARRNILESTVKISGKELFIEALIDFMDDKSLEEQMLTLESLKIGTGDWKVIDNKINEILKTIDENKEFNNNKKQISKIKTLLDTYSDDERFESIVENMVSKSKNSEEANLMAITSKKMKFNFKFIDYSKKQLSFISEKYEKKANELSFRENGYTK